ncbi:hypothetical protein [Thioalkalivibrio thiocyanoxidans]|uniref:hypothetical protein n=1 Tax=Thioalkalivibrio thiocyanoxidans TaxID=152475 RepID=UPI000376C759|nr:hypothetical protein [Thioalkalivibrio thiocyanoxidans]
MVHSLASRAWALAGLVVLAVLPASADTPRPGGASEPPAAATRVLHTDPEGLHRAVRQLRPGDHLQLAPGEYPEPLVLRGVSGTAERPIVITGPDSGDPAILRGRAGSNTIRLINAAHLVIRHLTLEGDGHNIAGVVVEHDSEYAHDITLEHLTIRGYDRSQGNSGITTRAPAWNWTIRHNDIRDAGTGMYLGRPDGTGPFVAGLIEHNFIGRTLGYNMQIKHQRPRASRAGMPTEPHATIIRHNVFSKAERASSGHRARPNLLVGHFPPEGPGQHDWYWIYGNLFYQNPHQRLFQGEGRLAMYNNLFFNDAGSALVVQPHNHIPKDVLIVHNTVVARGFGIRLIPGDRRYEQLITGNAVFADPAIDAARTAQTEINHEAGFERASAYLAQPHAALAELDLFPLEGTLAYEGLPEFQSPLPPDLDRDYNDRDRSAPRYGAYAGDRESNPGRREGVGPAALDCKPCR